MHVANIPLRIMVAAGGPDRERAVSLQSADQVVAALIEAGHDVRLADVGPDDLSSLDAFEAWPGDVVFPVLHGPWGEGGEFQRKLERRGLPFVGSKAAAAELCMDKHLTKIALMRNGLPTPHHEIITTQPPTQLRPPLVIKPLREGSSFDLFICRSVADVQPTLEQLAGRYDRLMVEQYVAGKELTVSVITGPRGDQVMPPIQIVPAGEFYDYQAKYERDDTRYLFEIDLPADLLDEIGSLSLKAHAALGCRHLSRVDFIVDDDRAPWILEINTIPGFTSHSLLPMAAAHAGIPLAELTDRLARLGAGTSCKDHHDVTRP